MENKPKQNDQGKLDSVKDSPARQEMKEFIEKYGGSSNLKQYEDLEIVNARKFVQRNK